ncbi:hypothetical protein BDD26_2732 [Xenorhabdus cabanillasii]|uniref:Uncharacterized protein n=1 Tax=Xenorhabdus cabanillasii TaxID=351673 RepID=A0A3D9UPH3_9GAMM|nr:hypothetical protein BDD26_2732 [Xenorhabdus cabanillasii]
MRLESTDAEDEDNSLTGKMAKLTALNPDVSRFVYRSMR